MVIVDTCSLVYLSRFYLPFDEGDQLKRFFENQFRNRKLVMLDVVLDECKHQSQGLVINSMPFLRSEKSLIIKTTELTAPAPQKFSNLLDNNFCNSLERKRLSDKLYEVQKQVFLDSGDGKIIIFALNKKYDQGLLDDKIVVLTDESKISNDGKLFKKLPAICQFLQINTITLVDYLKENNINIDWIVPECSLGT